MVIEQYRYRIQNNITGQLYTFKSLVQARIPATDWSLSVSYPMTWTILSITDDEEAFDTFSKHVSLPPTPFVTERLQDLVLLPHPLFL